MQVAAKLQGHTGAYEGEILDDALAAAGTPESRDLLLQRFLIASLAAEQSRIIHLLARQPSQGTAAALLWFTEQPDRGAYLRLQAARALVETGLEFPQQRLFAALEQIQKACQPNCVRKPSSCAQECSPETTKPETKLTGSY